MRMHNVLKDHETKMEQKQLRIKNLERDLKQLKKFNQEQQRQLQEIKTEEDSASPVQLAANTTPVLV